MCGGRCGHVWGKMWACVREDEGMCGGKMWTCEEVWACEAFHTIVFQHARKHMMYECNMCSRVHVQRVPLTHKFTHTQTIVIP